MTKLEFLKELGTRLPSMASEDKKKVLDYYSELIDDYTEDGLSVDDAIEKMGGVEAIANSIKNEIAQKKSNGFARSLSKTAFVSLCTLLGIGAFAGGITLICLSVCCFAFGLSAIALIPTGITFFFKSAFAAGFFTVGGAFVLAGLSLALEVSVFLLFKYCRAFRRWLLKSGKECENK